MPSLRRQNFSFTQKLTVMPKFEIEVDICLGFSHCGGVYNDAYGEVELSDKEVEQLVNLMKEKESSNIEELELKTTLPEIYNKLDEAYNASACKAEEEHWLDEGYYHLECHNYEDADMIAYLKEKNAWNFEYDEEEFKAETGELDEEALFDAECDYLHEEALDDYLSSLNGEERYDFLRNKVGIDVDMSFSDSEYEITIPSEIIAIAFPEGE